MIENIRKFRFLIILGLAAVALGLVIGIKDDVFRGGSHGAPMFRIDGRTYGEKEFNNLGSGALEVISGLAASGDFGMYSYVIALTSGAMGDDAGREQFFTNRILMRKAAEEFGIRPGDEQVANHIRSMRAFSGPDQQFNEQTYRRFIDRGIGRLGLTENDFLALIADFLAHEKIMEVTSGGLTENRDATATRIALENQQISAELASLAIDSFEQDAQPTDEQLKGYWENLRDAFTTEELRKFSYILVTPDIPAEDDSDKDSTESSDPDSAGLTEEQKKEQEEAEAKKATDLAEARRAAQIATNKLVDDFSLMLEEQGGNGFEELAASDLFRWQTKTTELFARSSPPADLDSPLRSSSQGGRAVTELFKISPTSDPLSKISLPIAVGENQWLVARLDETIKPREKTFDEAKDEARLQYVKEKAAEAMKAKAEAAIASIRTALAEGTSFADAATAAGLQNPKQIDKVNSYYQPNPAGEPANLFEAARYVTPGELADPIIESDRAFVLLVKSREVFKNPNPEAMIDGQVKSAASTNVYTAFNDWLDARREASKIEKLFRN